uniref:Uncharacterized protein n=1 Tax=Anguilla anguilla TaxID=7936 RepID=A0A0E9SUS0_ANGAN
MELKPLYLPSCTSASEPSHSCIIHTPY